MVLSFSSYYSGYLAARANLVYFENNPKIWKDGHGGLPPTQDWETFKAALIDRRIWQYQQIKTAKGNDPEVTGGMFTGDDYKTFQKNGCRDRWAF